MRNHSGALFLANKGFPLCRVGNGGVSSRAWPTQKGLPLKNLLITPLALVCALSAFSAQGVEETSFEIEKIASGDACRVVATNKSAAPVTITAKIAEGVHQYQSDRKWPLREVVPPNSTHEIARVFTKGEREPCRIEMTYSHSIGNAFAVPDRHYKYRLPFKAGTVVYVTQEPNGVLTTHKDAMNRYAFDFGVPQGTPVFAVRAGTVIETRDSFKEGRISRELTEKANLVSILHSDGTFAQYVHLAPQGVLVRPGERVEAGQMIGRSGRTGYAGGPHLHVDLRRARIGANGIVRQESLPFDFFRQGSGKKITLRRHRRITAD
jgi:murein DD-endopeptidase MepM/ murein hydrolase activator NlpD